MRLKSIVVGECHPSRGRRVERNDPDGLIDMCVSQHAHTHKDTQRHTKTDTPSFRPAMQTQGKFHQLLKEKAMNDTTAGRDYTTSKITMETWT